ncbi:putative transcription factor bzip protein [Neofusicoccum parvum UCRNP2]|uniref:Putative transcription factor bzip protein n=1 Tax=Botryosphaeria parva (strain UCR-NP2) TaxID=1287680 RepID=R1EB41_BOTPV|nr:putative transcription factor bzip protein [Neofusicoccum parvum UCRNP2]
MLSMFQGLNRPLAMPWYTPTRIYKHVASLLAWQLHPTREMYVHLHPNFRPTALQVSESYPAIIDWCLLPSVRDRLILTCAANSRLDDVILDISHAYCVEADLSTLVATAPRPTPGFVGLWDVIQAMGDDDDDNNDDADIDVLPAPSPAALFASPALARRAFRRLRMDAGLGVFRLDPAFFAKYPELYSPELADVLAAGAALRPPGEAWTRLPPPPEGVEIGTVRLYRHLADWVVNVVCDEPW